MAIKCFKCEVPELNRTCITAVIELPLKGSHEYVPTDGHKVESVSIATVDGHPDILTLAIMLSKEKEDAKPSTYDC